MPGILTMNHEPGAITGPREGEIKKRTFEGKLVNGDPHDPLDTSTPNGGPSKGSSSALAVSAPLVPTPDQFAQLPPEIAHISRDQYHSLSTLLLRISQETYNDLSETLQSMAELPLVQQSNGVLPNGAMPHRNGQENEDTNRRKKLLLMKFAQDNRAKFIKLLVLTEWGKKELHGLCGCADRTHQALLKCCWRAQPRYYHRPRDLVYRQSSMDANVRVHTTRAHLFRKSPRPPSLYEHFAFHTIERSRRSSTSPAQLAHRVGTRYIRLGERA
jgi:hypothetical protein